MNARTVILAFLSERAPAAYSAETIETRVNRSGLVDNPVISIGSELDYLASERMGKLVDCQIDPVSKAPYWFATDAGVKSWTVSGRQHVG